MTGSVLLLMGFGVCGAAVAFLLFHASSRLTLVAWTATLYFIPVWVGVSVGFFWSAITLITLLALAANVGNIRFVLADALMLVFIIIVVTLLALHMVTISAVVIALLEWALPYLWGRIVLVRLDTDYLTKVIATAAIVAAVLAIAEFLSGLNIFSHFPAMSNSLYAEWGGGQMRAGDLRAEGAWGHSIALGAALSMSSSFVMAARWPSAVRFLGLAVVSAGTVVTLSRIGLVTLGLTVALGLILLPQLTRALRVGLTLAAAVAAMLIIPFISSILFEAGTEAAGSAEYRTRLFSLVAQLRPFGGSNDWSLVVGDIYMGSFARSIDNAALLFALRFGWVAAAILVLILVLCAVLAFRRAHASPAAISVAAQVPTLFVVALITQFGMFLWFLAGLALSWKQLAASESATTRAGRVDKDARVLESHSLSP